MCGRNSNYSTGASIAVSVSALRSVVDTFVAPCRICRGHHPRKPPPSPPSMAFRKMFRRSRQVLLYRGQLGIGQFDRPSPRFD